LGVGQADVAHEARRVARSAVEGHESGRHELSEISLKRERGSVRAWPGPELKARRSADPDLKG